MGVNGNYSLEPALDATIRAHEQKAQELRAWREKQRAKRRNKRR